ncbi:PhoU Phosphate uptake regulator [Burkholderiales bacterium]
MNTTSHTMAQFDAELEEVRTKILKMGGHVEEMIKHAIVGFATGNTAELKDVLEMEKRVNAFEIEIDDICNHIIAKRQPAASDLRFLVASLKMIRDLERAGDEAEKMARMAIRFYEGGPSISPRMDFTAMSTHVTSMLHRALDAYAREDESVLQGVLHEDKIVDDHFRNTIRLLISYVLEDSRTISRSIDMLFYAKAMERIGDHSKNMAEHVVYMVKGRDVRHATEGSAQ